MGEASGGRSATTPTFSQLTSRRTMMDLQKGQVVCTAADHRNSTGAPQFGQLAVLWDMFMARRDDPQNARERHWPRPPRGAPRRNPSPAADDSRTGSNTG